MFVEVKQLVKRYGDLIALDHLSFEAKKGEILGLLGPNGSGKTTAINCLLSLLEYDKGEIIIDGKKMHPEAYDIKRDIGVIMQDVAVFYELNVYDNIDYFCGLYIKDKKIRRTYVEEAIKFVGLEDYKKFYPNKLSGGLLRRLNIACGIAHKPKLIILDEPTVAVDPQSRNNILTGIKRLKEEGATIIYTSHYMEEIEQLCDYIIIIDKGSVVAKGTKEELKAMIAAGETIQIEEIELTGEQLIQIKELPYVEKIEYDKQSLNIRYMKGNHNLNTLINYLTEEKINFGNLYTSVPTLNDVFLEITGRGLRD